MKGFLKLIQKAKNFILIYIFITEKNLKISRRGKSKNELHDLKVNKKLYMEH